jgi:hypothetical protein
MDQLQDGNARLTADDAIGTSELTPPVLGETASWKCAVVMFDSSEPCSCWKPANEGARTGHCAAISARIWLASCRAVADA